MDQKFIVITGVSRGLGNALTEGFINLGHTVTGTARSADAISDLSDRYPAPHRFDTVDHADPVQVQAWVASVIEQHGAPDLLINNAATINANARLWEVPESEFSQVIDINVKGVFYTCKYFLPEMIKQGSGIIVNLSSTWGRSVSPEVAPYCASKFAVEGLTQALAQELPNGLAAAPLNPGVINTDMLQSCFADGANNYGTAAEWAKTAVPFLLALDTSCNGKQLTAPG